MTPVRLFSISKKIRSISAVIALVSLVGGILFALIIAGASYWMQRAYDIQDLQARAQQVSDQINYISEVLLNKGDLSSVQRIVENVSTDRGILFIAIVDEELKVLASSRHDLLGRPLSEQVAGSEVVKAFQRVVRLGRPEFSHRAREGHFEIIAPITLSNPSRTRPLVSGAVTVSFRDDPLIWNPQESFRRHFQLSLGLTTLAIIILYGTLRRWVTSPLERLTSAAERLGSGELGIQIPVRSTNEIGKLSATFNAMSTSLAEQQRALQASEERYLRIFHSSSNSLIVVDVAGMIVDVNDTLLAQTGTPGRQTWIGKSVAEVPIIQRTELSFDIKDLLKEGTPFKRWKVPVSLTGSEYPSFFNLSGIPLFDNAGALTGAVIAVEDITAEQRLEAQLIQSQKMESLGVLAGGVAHDFNNILTGILGYASLLKMRLSPGDPNYKAATVIEKSSLRARDLIQQLLGFARRTPPMKTVVEVNRIVSEILFLLQKGVGPQVIVTADLDPSNCKIVADAGQIHQALMNLCVNARDALSPQGGSIFLRTRIVPLSSVSDSDRPGDWVEISVQDTGSGIPPEILPRIFEPFFTTKEVGKGTGLGLSVTYGIVKENGGELAVRSEPGRGSTFLIRFPITEERFVSDKKAGPPEGLKGEMRGILLVDDEPDLLDLEGNVLTEKGFFVLRASSGEEAIRLYQKQKEKICLVILDLLMPGMDGWSTYQKLRKINPELKVLFTSGYAGMKEVEGRFGVLPFLKKPFRIEDFLTAVRNALQSARGDVSFRFRQ